MKPKYARLRFLLLSMLVMAGAATAILYSFRDNLVFFYTPSQLVEKQSRGEVNRSQAVRIGGLVKAGSVKNIAGGGLAFIITDLNHDVPVTYRGLVPSLFREGQGIVAQGILGADGQMTAATILAKHDENYMPREVVDALKASGRWQNGRAQ